GLAAADFNGDGKLDFAQADAFGNAAVFGGNGDGTFGAPHFLVTGGANPFGLASGDFNGDGRPDLVVANTFSDTVAVLLNIGQVPAATITLTTSVPSPVAGQTETLTATVTSPAGTPTGNVTFFDGNTALNFGPLNAAGEITWTVALGAGDHVLTAVYQGDNAFDPST